MNLRRRHQVVLMAGAVACVGVGTLYVVPLTLTRSPRPSTAKDVLAAQNDARAVCVAFLIAVGTFLTGWIGWRTFHLSRAGNLTDRYSRSVEQLASASPDVRIGGIFALEAITRDAPNFTSTVIEVLSAFVRGDTSSQQPAAARPLDAVASSAPAGKDAQLAIKVLLRLDRARAHGRVDLRLAQLRRLELPSQANMERVRGFGIDLAGATLRRALLCDASFARADMRETVLDRAIASRVRLDGCNLSGASLIDATIDDARLRSADLSSAFLIRTDLRGSDLSGSLMRGVRLDGADVRSASLRRADLTGAVLTDAKLDGADIEEARLSGARVTRGGLTDEQLRSARGTDAIVWA